MYRKSLAWCLIQARHSVRVSFLSFFIIFIILLPWCLVPHKLSTNKLAVITDSFINVCRVDKIISEWIKENGRKGGREGGKRRGRIEEGRGKEKGSE